MTKQDKGLTRWKGTLLAVGTLAVLAAAPVRAESPNKGRLSLRVGSDFTTAYFFRGILQERDGFIWQPYGELGFNLYTADEASADPVRTFSLFAGTWNSIQSEKTLSDGSGPGNWYESDFYAGLKANFFGNTEAKAFYIAYAYPNGAFNTVQELDAVFSLNDSDWLGTFALYPSVTIAGEMDNTALGTDKGYYFEVGARPSFTIVKSDTYPVSLAVPLTVGMGSNYFDLSTTDDDFFGYFRGGLIFGVPLAFIPPDYGTWSVNAGAYIYTFGDNLQEANLGDDPWVVGTWGFSMTY